MNSGVYGGLFKGMIKTCKMCDIAFIPSLQAFIVCSTTVHASGATCG